MLLWFPAPQNSKCGNCLFSVSLDGNKSLVIAVVVVDNDDNDDGVVAILVFVIRSFVV